MRGCRATAVTSGRAGPGDWAALGPFFHGRWDAEAEEFEATASQRKNQEAGRAFGADGAFDPAATCGALGALRSPVLVLAGALDLQLPRATAEAMAALFPGGTLVVQEGAAHYPWRDDADRFAAALGPFLAA